MEYVIEGGRYAGVRLEIGRIPRQYIDRFIGDHPEPEAPEKPASELGKEVWGDPDQLLRDLNDPAYVEKRNEWANTFSEEMFALLVEAVSIVDDVTLAEQELDDLVKLGLAQHHDKRTLVAGVLASSENDLRAIVELAMYNSTVTIRGLYEAAKLFGIHWQGKRVPVVEMGKGSLRANGAFTDRVAAIAHGYRDWDEFCGLSGPRQSEIVALYRYRLKLEEIAAKDRQK